MSSNNMLKQAIIDANALREVALKNAEAIVVQKYSTQIKEAVDVMLEQEEELESAELEISPGGIAPQTTLAAVDGEPLCPCPEKEQTIKVDFEDLQQIMADLEGEEGEEALPGPTPPEVLPIQEDEDVEFDLSDLIAELQNPDETDTIGMPEDEDQQYGDELAAETGGTDPVDITSEMKTYKRDDKEDDEDEKEDTALQESHQKNKKILKENKVLSKKNSKVIQENQSLREKKKSLLSENKEMRVILEKLSTTLADTNLSNAKLVYTNRVLTSNSLNERQKQRIAEAINNADSVDAAKSIYETLQSAVGSSLQTENGPKSLGEAIIKGSTTMLRQKQKEKTQDPFMHRMKKLAGI